MCIVRLVLVSSVLIAVGAHAVAQAAGAATLRFGGVDGANATFIIGENAKRRAIVPRTAPAGVAGSRIELTVDRVKEPVFRHIFAPGECKFGESGSACEVTILEKDAAYRAILTRFKDGRLARITVQDAGVSKIDKTAPLQNKREAISHAAYTILRALAPQRARALAERMTALGYDPNATTAPAALGRRAAMAVLAKFRQDGANEAGGFADTTGYKTGGAEDPAAWRPILSFGKPQLPTTPQWRRVLPFALTRADQFLPPPPPGRS